MLLDNFKKNDAIHVKTQVGKSMAVKNQEKSFERDMIEEA